MNKADIFMQVDISTSILEINLVSRATLQTRHVKETMNTQTKNYNLWTTQSIVPYTVWKDNTGQNLELTTTTCFSPFMSTGPLSGAWNNILQDRHSVAHHAALSAFALKMWPPPLDSTHSFLQAENSYFGNNIKKPSAEE